MDDMHGLRVWDSARELESVVVKLARRNKLRDPAEIFSQLCRAANSVGANISEAMGASTPGERLQFLRHAHRSGWETRHHIRAGSDCGFFNRRAYRWLSNRALVNVRMIIGLIVKIERRAEALDSVAERPRRRIKKSKRKESGRRTERRRIKE